MPQDSLDRTGDGVAVRNSVTFAAAGSPTPFEEALTSEGAEPQERGPRPLTPGARRRLLAALAVMIVVGMMAVLPPLVNVSRYQRRIASSISASLGRPVHMDSVTLNLLPWPGFTLTNFVVSENPEFGAEPVIRADSVRARLRIRSLWRRRVEFSRIALDGPSVNLVRRGDGRWNVESILLQASRVTVAPTGQKTAGDAPRFPYIEATGARVNFKSALEKKPLSLTDAEFALWLPKPEMWRIQLEAHPARTDTAASDTGTFRLEGTLGKAGQLEDVPMDLRAAWTAVPLGAASWVLMGRDAGMRGEMTLRASVKGTVGVNTATVRLEMEGVRRADFVPSRPLSVDVSCKAQTEAVFHKLTGVRCLWPPDAEQRGLGGLIATGDIDDIHRRENARLDVAWSGVQVQDLMDVLRVGSPRVSPELLAGGTFSGNWSCCGDGPGLGNSGELSLEHLRVSLSGARIHQEDEEIPGAFAGRSVSLDSIALDLGGAQPSQLTVSADDGGVKMRLIGTALRSRLLALATALPQFGDGLETVLPAPAAAPEQPIHLDLAASRPWGGGQSWASGAVPKAKSRQPHVNARRAR